MHHVRTDSSNGDPLMWGSLTLAQSFHIHSACTYKHVAPPPIITTHLQEVVQPQQRELMLEVDSEVHVLCRVHNNVDEIHDSSLEGRQDDTVGKQWPIVFSGGIIQAGSWHNTL